MAKKKIETTPYSKGHHGRPIDRATRAGRAEKIAVPAPVAPKLKAAKSSKPSISDNAGVFE